MKRDIFMFKKTALFVLILTVAAFAECQVPDAPSESNYAKQFEYGQELMVAAKCFVDSGAAGQAKEYYTDAIEKFESALVFVKSGTDYELRANVFKKIGDAYSELNIIEPSETYSLNAAENYKKAEIESSRTSEYLVYGGIALVIIILGIVLFLVFRRKKGEPELVPYKPAPAPISRAPAVMQRALTLNTLSMKQEVKEKYKDKMRQKYGL